jgi:hypothetical protein
MAKASDNNFPSVLLADQSGTPTTPAASHSRIYTKSDGLYVVDGGGVVTGPLGGICTDGWIAASETWTYASTDAPTYTFTVAADVTTKYSPGMRLKCTDNSTVKYFIITAVSAYSPPNTTITVYGGTDYTLAGGAISLNYYSMHKAPRGFPINPIKWTEILSDTSSRLQNSPAVSVWYNLGSLSLSVPIGAWELSFQCCAHYISGSGVIELYVELSTVNNASSDAALQCFFYSGAAATDAIWYASRVKQVLLASKTAYYLIAKQDTASPANSIKFRGDQTTTVIMARCAYL